MAGVITLLVQERHDNFHQLVPVCTVDLPEFETLRSKMVNMLLHHAQYSCVYASMKWTFKWLGL